MDADKAEETDAANDETPKNTYDQGVIDIVTALSILGVLYSAYTIWYVAPNYIDLF